MATICPTVTAYDIDVYRQQMRIATGLSSRVHVDMMDGIFASTVSPSVEQVWLPHGYQFDIHLMYQKPMEYIEPLVKLKPHMVIIHAEADVNHALFAAEMHRAGILCGLALLSDTSVNTNESILSGFDHALVFSGHLGYHGGQADLSLLEKVKQIKAHYPGIEVSWDGGVTNENAAWMVKNGVDVLNVGGYVQASPDPAQAYATLKAVLDTKVRNLF